MTLKRFPIPVLLGNEWFSPVARAPSAAAHSFRFLVVPRRWRGQLSVEVTVEWLHDLLTTRYILSRQWTSSSPSCPTRSKNDVCTLLLLETIFSEGYTLHVCLNSSLLNVDRDFRNTTFVEGNITLSFFGCIPGLFAAVSVKSGLRSWW